MNASRLRERKDEINLKCINTKQEATKGDNWNDNKLIGSDMSIRESFEKDMQLPFSLRGLKYMQTTRGQIIMPLIVVENDSVLELRDSLLRSARND